MINWAFSLTCAFVGLVLILLIYEFIPEHQMIETRLHFPILSAFMIVALKLWLDHKIFGMVWRVLIGLGVGYVAGILAQLMVMAWMGTLIKFFSSPLLQHLPLNPLLLLSMLMGMLVFVVPNILVDRSPK
jgi:hypothetical protein